MTVRDGSVTAAKIKDASVRASTIAAEPQVALVTIPNVELVSVGDWHASTGDITFTAEHLAAAVAAMDDASVHAPRLRIGHTPPSYNAEMSAGGFEEQPAFGRFENLRLNATGTTIVADAVGVPAWLAEILPSAFPSRSIEGFWNVQTAQGRSHDFVITSVALLGVSMPAVETLEDLRLAFGAEMPDGVEFLSGDRVAATRGGEMPENRVAASVTYTDVRHSFYEDVAEGDRYWWWICDFIMSPSTVIADDDEGGLWSIPYTLKGESVEWGEPVEVRIQYVEAESGKVAASKPADLAGYRAEYVSGGGSLHLPAPPAPVFVAASSRPIDRVRAENTNEGGSTVDISTLRDQLAMPDATDDEVIAAAAEKLAATPEEEPEVETPEVEEAAEPTGAVVEPAALAQLQADAKLGREAREQQIAADRESIVKERIDGGFIAPASKAGHLAELAKGGEIEKAHRAYLASLTSVLVPVDERGRSGESQNDTQAALTNVRAHLGLVKAN